MAVADVGRGDEERERVLGLWVEQASRGLLLELPRALLAVAAEGEFLLVAPQDRGPGSDECFREEVVEVDDLMFFFVGGRRRRRGRAAAVREEEEEKEEEEGG